MRQMIPDRLAEGQDARRQRKRWVALGASLFRLVGYQGQISDCRSHQQLEQGLFTPEVACLPHPQLHQARKPVFGCLPYLARLLERSSLLEISSLLQQTLLRMQSDGSSLAPFSPHAFRPPGAGVAGISIKKERPALVLLSMAVCPPACLDQGLRCLSGRTSTGHVLQIDSELCLGYLSSAPMPADLGHQLAILISKYLACVATAISTIADCFFHFQPGVFLTGCGQFQRLFTVGCITSQDFYRRDQLTIRVDRNGGLVPIKPLRTCLLYTSDAADDN